MNILTEQIIFLLRKHYARGHYLVSGIAPGQMHVQAIASPN